jgi:hypothetical protein
MKILLDENFPLALVRRLVRYPYCVLGLYGLGELLCD